MELNLKKASLEDVIKNVNDGLILTKGKYNYEIIDILDLPELVENKAELFMIEENAKKSNELTLGTGDYSIVDFDNCLYVIEERVKGDVGTTKTVYLNEVIQTSILKLEFKNSKSVDTWIEYLNKIKNNMTL